MDLSPTFMTGLIISMSTFSIFHSVQWTDHLSPSKAIIFSEYKSVSFSEYRSTQCVKIYSKVGYKLSHQNVFCCDQSALSPGKPIVVRES